jgi:hypothetical protein
MGVGGRICTVPHCLSASHWEVIIFLSLACLLALLGPQNSESINSSFKRCDHVNLRESIYIDKEVDADPESEQTRPDILDCNPQGDHC